MRSRGFSALQKDYLCNLIAWFEYQNRRITAMMMQIFYALL